jgi:hypothetical protein
MRFRGEFLLFSGQRYTTTRAVDPDPALQVNPDTDPDPICIQGSDDQKLKKKIPRKIAIF